MTGSNPEQPRSDGLPPAGWYRDSAGQAARWWDGEQWGMSDNSEAPGTSPESPPPMNQHRLGQLQQRSVFWDFVLRWRRFIIVAIALLPVIVVVAGIAANSQDEASYQEGRYWGERWATNVGTPSGSYGGVTNSQIDAHCTNLAITALSEGDYDRDDYEQGCLDGVYSVLE